MNNRILESDFIGNHGPLENMHPTNFFNPQLMPQFKPMQNPMIHKNNFMAGYGLNSKVEHFETPAGLGIRTIV